MKNFNLNSFGFLRVASVSPECKVADVQFNVEYIIKQIEIAAKSNCQIVLFPELCISSYSVADLFNQKLLLDKSIESLRLIQATTEKHLITAIIGMPIVDAGRLYNCAVVVSNGIIAGVVPKTHIPTNNEFYEARWFSSETARINNSLTINGDVVHFGADIIFEASGNSQVKFGIEICEDLWAVFPPSSDLALAGANVIFNLSASNEYLGKADYRRELVKSQSARLNSAYIYSSAGPGESSTDIVFSGHCIIAENGTILSQNDRFKFQSDMIIADIDLDKLDTERFKNKTFANSKPTKSFRKVSIDLPNTEVKKLFRSIAQTPFIPANNADKNNTCNEIFRIQATALSKRLKSINCKNLVLGLSGGLDSTLALLVAIESFKSIGLPLSGIHCILMPGFGTTARTRNNAEALCELFNVSYRVIPIHKSVHQHFSDIGHNPEDLSIVYENAQARERTQILMDVSNQVNGIVLGTGDLSEIALGWSTYNADHISMYNVNCGVPKTLVKYIVKWCADELFSGEVSGYLNDICNTPISPELLPPNDNGEIAQETEKTVGSYILNDFFLYHFFRFQYCPRKLFLLACIAFADSFAPSDIKHWLRMFYVRFFRSQFKRTCVPDGPKIGSVALSPRGDWRMSTDTELNLWLDEIDSIHL